MYWNRNYKDKVEVKDAGIVVHELASEVHIVGGAEYFDGNILNRSYR